MLPTPSTSHVDYDQIYEPAEDSFLLIDTLSSPSETSFLHDRFLAYCPLVLEIGTGSGVVLAFVTAHVSHIFGNAAVATLGIDVSRPACQATSTTVELASQQQAAQTGVFLNILAADLTSAVRPGCIDVLIFNPPYVPSEDLPNGTGEQICRNPLDQNNHLLSLATDGGEDGMQTTNRLLAELSDILSSRGLAYILLCAQNKPEKIMDQIRDWPGSWSVERVGSSGSKAGWEKLCVIRIWR